MFYRFKGEGFILGRTKYRLSWNKSTEMGRPGFQITGLINDSPILHGPGVVSLET